MNDADRTELDKLRNIPDRELTQEQLTRLTILSLRNKNEQRCRWGPLWAVLGHILFEVDPERLCRIGAPYDEYDPEIPRILTELTAMHRNGSLTVESAEEAMAEIFQDMFHPKGTVSQRSPGLHKAAERIVQFFQGEPFVFRIEELKQFIK